MTFSFEYKLCFKRQKKLHALSYLNSKIQKYICQKKEQGHIFLSTNSGSDIWKTEHQVRKVITNDNFF